VNQYRCSSFCSYLQPVVAHNRHLVDLGPTGCVATLTTGNVLGIVAAIALVGSVPGYEHSRRAIQHDFTLRAVPRQNVPLTAFKTNRLNGGKSIMVLRIGTNS
jgi:hypothetical protein